LYLPAAAATVAALVGIRRRKSRILCLSGVSARLVPSSLLFFSFVFFFFCFLNSNSGAASFSSSSPASASFYFMCFDKESRPTEAPQVVPPALCNCGCFPEP
jgi:hypothetical protein